jgi:hypothetical protein
MRELWAMDPPMVTSWVTFAEARAAIAAARRSRRLSRIAATTAARRLEEEWESLSAFVADEATCRVAGQLASRHRLRGVDGIQLAAALPFRRARIVFVTFDLRLARAARAEGLSVVGV